MQFDLTPVVRNIILINVGVFALQFFGADIVHWFGLRYPTSREFYPYQFFTYIFTQSSPGHLFSNMFGLFMFGPLLERFWGSQRFLFFYLFTGVGASFLYTGINAYQIYHLQQATEAYIQSPTPTQLLGYINEFAPQARGAIDEFINNFETNAADPEYIRSSVNEVRNLANVLYRQLVDQPMVGASGAIFGILMAFGLLFPNTELFLLFFPFPIKAKYFVAMYGLFELYSGIQRQPGDNVAHFAHLGGMLFAYILIRYWGTRRDKFY